MDKTRKYIIRYEMAANSYLGAQSINTEMFFKNCCFLFERFFQTPDFTRFWPIAMKPEMIADFQSPSPDMTE